MSIIFNNSINKISRIPITIKTFAGGVIEVQIHNDHTSQEDIPQQQIAYAAVQQAMAQKSQSQAEAAAIAPAAFICPQTGLPDQHGCNTGHDSDKCFLSGKKLPGRSPISIPNLEVGTINFNLEITYHTDKTLDIDVVQI